MVGRSNLLEELHMADESRWRDEFRYGLDPRERARWNAWRDERDHGRHDREFGGSYDSYGAGFDPYGGGYTRDARRNNYPQGEHSRFGYGRDYDAPYRGSGYYGNARQGRDWWDRTSDEVSSWLGDDDARRRRDMDAQDRGHRGRGPKGYTRSDDRIREDVSDRLSDDPMVDASEIEVSVAGSEVTLAGTVSSREERRRAEDCAERVSGVSHVQNNLRLSSVSSSTDGAGATGTRASGRNDNSIPGRSAH
jgi:osmotically-inducible protein OsmY